MILLNGRALPEGYGLRIERSLEGWPHAFLTHRVRETLSDLIMPHYETVGPLMSGDRISSDGVLVHVESRPL